MQIRIVAERTGLNAPTIRYYESIGLLPEPERLPNGYRDYSEEDVARLQFVAGARTLDFLLDDIGEILALRDRREAPCRIVLDLLREKEKGIARRITELKRLRGELQELYQLGETFPTDDVEGKACVCHLISEQAENRRTIARNGNGRT